jgi:hypothetical protein
MSAFGGSSVVYHSYNVEKTASSILEACVGTDLSILDRFVGDDVVKILTQRLKYDGNKALQKASLVLRGNCITSQVTSH